MKLLDRYVVREMVVPFLIGQGAVVMMLTGTVLFNNADKFFNFRIPAAGVARIALCFLPHLISLTMPVAVAIAASLAVSRLARDSEITVMRASGVSLRRIFRPIAIVGFVMSLLDIAIGETVVPWANSQYGATLSEISTSVKSFVPQDRTTIVSPDRVYTARIERMEVLGASRAKLQGVAITVQGTSGQGLIVHQADTADYADGKWTLHDASTYVFAQGGDDVRFIRGETTVNFKLVERTFDLVRLDLPLYSEGTATTTARELVKRIGEQRKSGYVSQYDLLDLNFKLSVPFSCLVFAIACPPLALRFARAGSFMGVLLSIVLVFVYWNTLLAARIFGLQFPHIFPPMVAAWGQCIVFALIGIFVRWREE